jgi:voltage-gated potassium channel Kch
MEQLFNLFSSAHVQVLLLLALILVSYVAFARWRPRIARAILREADRWSGLAIGVLGILVVVLGCIGFGRADGKDKETVPVALYETLQLFAFNAEVAPLRESPLLHIATVFAVMLAVTVAAKGIALLFHDSYVSLQLRFVSRHIVICGLGRVGRQLIDDLVVEGDQRTIVVVEPDASNPNLTWARDQGALVVIGDSTKRDVLEEAGVRRACELFIATGSDTSNIECVVEVRDSLKTLGRPSGLFRSLLPLRCYVHILDRDLADIVRARTDDLGDARESNLLDVEVFNALERTARRLLEDIATSTFDDRTMRPVAADEVAHYVMLGFGDFGQTLALRLAELAHFENGRRLRLTIVDRDIQPKATAFVARHPRFGPALGQIDAWDFDPTADSWSSHRYRSAATASQPIDEAIEYVCNAQYLEYCEATDDDFLNKMISSLEEKGTKPAILVCFEDDRQNFALAERMRSKLATLKRRYPIFVWIPRQRELSQLLSDQRDRVPSRSGAQSRRLCELIPFGQCYGSVSYTEVTKSWSEWLARRIPLVWMTKDNPNWQPVVEEFQTTLKAQDPKGMRVCLSKVELDSIADRLWESTNEWARASNRSSAIHTVIKAAVLGWRIVGHAASDETPQKDPENPPKLTPIDEPLRRMEHYRWAAERLLSGWRYDEMRDDVAKTRWQITSWEGLDHPPISVVEKAAQEGKKIDEKNKDASIIQLVIVLIQSGALQAERVDAKPGTP